MVSNYGPKQLLRGTPHRGYLIKNFPVKKQQSHRQTNGQTDRQTDSQYLKFSIQYQRERERETGGWMLEGGLWAKAK